MQAEARILTESEIRTMLFGLNLKLPVYFEMRETLNRQINSIQSEIAALNIQLDHRNGHVPVAEPVAIKRPRGRPPKAVTEAAAAPADVPTVSLARPRKTGRPWSEEERKRIGERSHQAWLRKSPAARRRAVAAQVAGRAAARKERNQ